MSEFNDFVFDYTSKIPVDEIAAKVKEIERETEKEERTRISSPYTRKRVKKAKLKPVFYYSIITIILVTITLIILNLFLSNKKAYDTFERSEGIYELA